MEQRAEIKQQIREGFEAGLHLMDAAEAIGMSADIVVANISTDEDFQMMYRESRTRLRMTSFETPDCLTPSEIKEGVVRAAIRAGAVEKIGIVIALADPTTAEGKKDLREFGLAVLKDHLPKETKRQVQDVPTLTAEEATRQLADSTRDLAELQQQLLDAESVYLEGVDGSGSQEAPGDPGSTEEEAD